MSNKLYLLGIVLAALVLSGCSGMTVGRYSYLPNDNRVNYAGESINASFYRAPNPEPKTMHLVGVVTPVPGAEGLPQVSGTLVDTSDGGKQLDLYVKMNTEN